MEARRVGMVIGASGVTGTPLAEQLAFAGWKVYGVSRREPQLSGGPYDRCHHISVHLTDTRGTRAAIAGCSDVTHVFHCSNDVRAETRLAIIGNILDSVDAAPALTNFNLMQGFKYYGSYLGPFKTPAEESDPRVPDGDFSEEDLVIERQRGKRWTWTAVRPTAVCGQDPRRAAKRGPRACLSEEPR